MNLIGYKVSYFNVLRQKDMSFIPQINNGNVKTLRKFINNLIGHYRNNNIHQLKTVQLIKIGQQ